MDDSIQTITQAFAAQVNKTPDALALTDEDQQLTYAELDALSSKIAGRLLEINPSPRFIGLVLDHGVKMIASILAILKAGAGYVPAEPTFPPERIRYMMKTCDAACAITQSEYAGLFASDLPLLDASSLNPLQNVPEVYRSNNTTEGLGSKSEPDPSDPAYILYTSGTTGQPKGIIVAHRNVVHYARAFINEFHPTTHDIMLQNSVCTFDIFTEEVFPLLLSGGSLAIPSAQTRGNLDKLMSFAAEKGVTIISGFPYLLNDINKQPDILPESVHLLIGGGDVLRASYVTSLIDKADVYNTYGPSETTVCAAYFHCNGTAALDDGTYPIGKPVRGAEIKLIDETGKPVSDGEPGEICIAGGGVSLGYINSRGELVDSIDKANSTAFVIDDDGRRWYHSGDMGRMLSDGNMAFLQRRDQQVMILGRRVEPQEVASVIAGFNGIEQAMVVSNLDEDGLAYLTAYIIADDGLANQRLLVSQIREYAAMYLPDYMVPEYFMVLDAMPLTPSGKINRNALPIVLKEGALH
jgi:amino acid adenylation domain-containing protein